MSSLDVTAPAPRVNFALMGQHIGKRVTIVGRVEGVEGSTLRLKTSDDGLVNVNLQGAAVPQVRPPVRSGVGGRQGRKQACGAGGNT